MLSESSLNLLILPTFQETHFSAVRTRYTSAQPTARHTQTCSSQQFVAMATDQQLLALQKRQTDYFTLWRNGNPIVLDYEIRDRRDVLQTITHPKPGLWRGLHRTTHHNGVRKRPARHQPARRQSNAGPAQTREKAESAVDRLAERIEVGGFRVVKTLGWGGLGVVALVEAWKGGVEGREEKIQVVAKVDLHKGKYGHLLRKEKKSHVAMAGSMHVVRRVVLAGKEGKREGKNWKENAYDEGESAFGRQVPPTRWRPTLRSMDEGIGEAYQWVEIADGNNERAKKRLDASEDMLFIEHMPRGDLDKYIKKAVAMGVRFPDRVLWQILECLFKACIAMAWPRRFRPQGADAEHNNLPMTSEDHEGCERKQPLTGVCSTMVHFDLDPLNILVGNYDAGEHNMVPHVKVGDLGLAEMIDWKFRHDAYAMWALRKVGKIDIYTPEQFTEEWDHVEKAPIAMPYAMAETTAGNYHWWTNLYQVGQVMWQLITRCRLEFPPYPEHFNDKWVDGEPVQSWSYGTYLLDERFAHVDRQLISLVVDCLKHDVRDRPTMTTIDAWMVLKVRNAPPMTPEEEKTVQRFCQFMFCDPKPPPRAPDPVPPIPPQTPPGAFPPPRPGAFSPKLSSPPRHLQRNPLSPIHKKSQTRIVSPSTNSLYGLSYKIGASKQAFHPVPINTHTAAKQEIYARQGFDTGAHGIAGIPPAPRGPVGPPALDDARIQELNRIGRNPLARTKWMYRQRAAGW